MRMARDPNDTFHDPNLKAAIRRAWGSERAPADLRSRIESQLTHERNSAQGPGDVIHVAPSFWRRASGRLALAAAAAVVFVGVAVVAYQMSGPGSTAAPVASSAGASAPAALEVEASPTKLPAKLGAQLVKAHDACIKYHPDEHHLFKAAPKNDYKLISQRMAAQLKYPVVATAMGDGWDFRGAALCPVGGKTVAHMMYRRDGAYVSVFSLPASAFPDCPEHQSCDAALDGHPLAGFAEAGGFYCVVASSPDGSSIKIDAEQVRAMRDKLRGDVVAVSRGEPVMYASLSFTR